MVNEKLTLKWAETGNLCLAGLLCTCGRESIHKILKTYTGDRNQRPKLQAIGYPVDREDQRLARYCADPVLAPLSPPPVL